MCTLGSIARVLLEFWQKISAALADVLADAKPIIAAGKLQKRMIRVSKGITMHHIENFKAQDGWNCLPPLELCVQTFKVFEINSCEIGATMPWNCKK